MAYNSPPTADEMEAMTPGVPDPADLYLCPGCTVRSPWEHRCCGDETGKQCECPDCQSTPADPGAIDLELYKEAIARRKHIDFVGVELTISAAKDLVAAVEALRERVADLESRYKLYKHIAKSVRGALDGEHTQRDILKIFDEQVDRAEAAEAREVELAVALVRAKQRKLIKREFVNVYDPDENKGKAGMHSLGRSSLSLTNDNAMDGRDAIIVREVYETRYEEHEIEDLAKLDALDKEKKKDA